MTVHHCDSLPINNARMCSKTINLFDTPICDIYLYGKNGITSKSILILKILIHINLNKALYNYYKELEILITIIRSHSKSFDIHTKVYIYNYYEKLFTFFDICS